MTRVRVTKVYKNNRRVLNLLKSDFEDLGLEDGGGLDISDCKIYSKKQMDKIKKCKTN
jgi:hypothetical protein